MKAFDGKACDCCLTMALIGVVIGWALGALNFACAMQINDTRDHFSAKIAYDNPDLNTRLSYDNKTHIVRVDRIVPIFRVEKVK